MFQKHVEEKTSDGEPLFTSYLAKKSSSPIWTPPVIIYFNEQKNKVIDDRKKSLKLVGIARAGQSPVAERILRAVGCTYLYQTLDNKLINSKKECLSYRRGMRSSLNPLTTLNVQGRVQWTANSRNLTPKRHYCLVYIKETQKGVDNLHVTGMMTKGCTITMVVWVK